jgi:hypothetical protein
MPPPGILRARRGFIDSRRVHRAGLVPEHVACVCARKGRAGGCGAAPRSRPGRRARHIRDPFRSARVLLVRGGLWTLPAEDYHARGREECRPPGGGIPQPWTAALGALAEPSRAPVHSAQQALLLVGNFGLVDEERRRSAKRLGPRRRTRFADGGTQYIAAKLLTPRLHERSAGSRSRSSPRRSG